MGLFKKKQQDNQTGENIKKNDALREDISKAYDEITANGDGGKKQEENNKTAVNMNLENELFKARVKIFTEQRTQAALNEVIRMLPGRKVLLPSVCNMKEPIENVNGEVKLKQGAAFNPALLTSKDNKVFLPIFTDEKSMVQKSPSGVNLRFSFEQCVRIVYDKKSPVCAIVINPFTENMILSEDLLRMVFKEKKN